MHVEILQEVQIKKRTQRHAELKGLIFSHIIQRIRLTVCYSSCWKWPPLPLRHAAVLCNGAIRRRGHNYSVGGTGIKCEPGERVE